MVKGLPHALVVINTMTKGKLEREGFTWLPCPHHSPSEEEEKGRSRSRNLKSKTEENMEECSLLALLFIVCLNVFPVR